MYIHVGNSVNEEEKRKAHINPRSHSINIVLGENGVLLYAKYCAKCYLISSSPEPWQVDTFIIPVLRERPAGTERLRKVPGVIQNVHELGFLAGRRALGLTRVSPRGC